MMREVKFRGRILQCLENAGQWVYWGINCTDMLDAIDPDTIGQLTGLNDCNGVDIYESDVVYIAGYGDYIVEFPFIDLYEAYPEGDIGEIKGNIYENQDLLAD